MIFFFFFFFFLLGRETMFGQETGQVLMFQKYILCNESTVVFVLDQNLTLKHISSNEDSMDFLDQNLTLKHISSNEGSMGFFRSKFDLKTYLE